MLGPLCGKPDSHARVKCPSAEAAPIPLRSTFNPKVGLFFIQIPFRIGTIPFADSKKGKEVLKRLITKAHKPYRSNSS